ncbi:MAG: tape measure protein [Limnochordales bacterium]|nr:tape measure protein [Limnochordales bacterium]
MADELYRSEIVIDINDRDAIARTERIQRKFEQSLARMDRLGKSLSQTRIAPMLTVRDRLTQSLLRADALVKRLSAEVATPVITARDEAQAVIDRISQAVETIDQGKADVAVSMRGEILKQIDAAEKAVRRISGAKGSPYAELKGPLLQQLEQAKEKVQKLDFTKAEPLVSLRDRLTAKLAQTDSKLKALNLQTASPILEARDRVSGVLARVDTMLRALDQGKIAIAAEMRGPLFDEITRAKATLRELSGINIGPVAQLRGELFGQLTKAEALLRSLDDMLVTPRATLIDRVSGTVSAISSRLRGLASRSWDVVIKAKDMVTGVVGRITRILTSPLTMLGIGVGAGAAVQAFGLRPLQAAGTMEQSEIAFETMLGRERGKAFLAELKKFAATTPYEFAGIQEAARQLLAFRFVAEEIPEMLTAIGNAAAGLGRGEEGMQRIILALGQMQAKTKVSAEEMLQLTEAGIPAWDMLAKAMGKTTAEVMKMAEKGLIPADQAIKILVKGMNEQFRGMMEKQSRSLFGLWSTIKDVFNLSLVTRWGDGLSRAVKPRLERLVDLFTKNEEVVDRWGDTLERAAYQVGEALFSKIESAFNRLDALMKEPRFQKADLFGKTQILWDEIIAKPFDRWWSSNGKVWATNAGLAIATTLGKALVEGIWTALKSNWIIRTLLLAWGGAKAGAGIGAIIGSLGGPIGTAAGAAIGAGVGAGVSGLWGLFNAAVRPGEGPLGLPSPVMPFKVEPTLTTIPALETAKIAATPITPVPVVAKEKEKAEALYVPDLQRLMEQARMQREAAEATAKQVLERAGRSLPGHALGTIATQPHIALVAERGPEAIIPLATEYRARALSLWQEVGARLGLPRLITGPMARSTLRLVTEAVIPLSPTWRAQAIALGQEVGEQFGLLIPGLRKVVDVAKEVAGKVARPPGIRPVLEPASVPTYAQGGILTRPHLGLVAEAGPEAIIPLSVAMRARAIALWSEVGRRLGIQRFAEGGIVGPASSPRWLGGNEQPVFALPSPTPVRAPTVVHIHIGPAVNTIVVRNEADIDRVADQAATILSRNLRAALANAIS